MMGESGVGMCQWRIAAEQPPHLACFAPMESTTDYYREQLFEGGVPALSFADFVLCSTIGDNYVDDVVAMAKKYPLMNAYWEDKRVNFSKIEVPAYITVGWNHFHLHGSMEGFRRIKSKKKWLRCHREFEWSDTYCHEHLEEVTLFFDRYLKGIRNCWESTPRVRIDVMDALDCDYTMYRPETSFPIKRTKYKKLYLNAENGTLNNEPIAYETQVSYDGKSGQTYFDIKFEEDVELTGYMKLHMWVEADGHDDMDFFVNVQKLDTKGEFLPTLVIGEPHPGAWGKLRVSHRALDPKLSTDFQPVLSHIKEEKLQLGEIVPVDIEIWPSSRFWHKGQSLRVEIAGRYIREEGWFKPLSWEPDNVGNHIIHTGGKYDSYLQVPVIPPRYQDDDIIYNVQRECKYLSE